MLTLTQRHRASLRGVFAHDVASVRELVSAGVPERTIYNRCLDGGPWQRLLPGIVQLSTGPPTDGQLVRAALLLGGAQCLITGIEACRRYGIRRGPVRRSAERGQPMVIQILVPSSRQVRSVGHVHVERTNRMPAPYVRDGIPLAPPDRACIDAVRRLRSAGEIAELLSDAVQRRLCTISALCVELDAGSRRGTAMPRAVLRELSAGARSAAEAAARRLWISAGLPDAAWNVEVRDQDGRFIGIADCWVDDVAMVWEIESSEWHLGPEEHTRTVERAAEFTAAGVVYTASKPSRVHRDPKSIAAVLRATYTQAAGRRRPPVVACPHRP